MVEIAKHDVVSDISPIIEKLILKINLLYGHFYLLLKKGECLIYNLNIFSGYGFDFTGSAAGYSQWGAAANRAAAQQQGHAVGAAAQQQGHAAGPTAAAAQQGHGAATTVAGAVEHTQHHQWGQPQRQQVATTEQQQQYYRQEHYTQVKVFVFNYRKKLLVVL